MAAIAQPLASPRGAAKPDDSLDRPVHGMSEAAELRRSAQSLAAAAMPVDRRFQALEQLRAPA